MGASGAERESEPISGCWYDRSAAREAAELPAPRVRLRAPRRGMYGIVHSV